MPTYTYRCGECDHKFEQRQRMSDVPLTECPVCGGRIRRVVSSVGIVFKGSGFYVTDNRDGSNPNGTGKSASQTKDKSEEKTAAKSESETSEKSEKKAAKEPAETST